MLKHFPHVNADMCVGQTPYEQDTYHGSWSFIHPQATRGRGLAPCFRKPSPSKSQLSSTTRGARQQRCHSLVQTGKPESFILSTLITSDPPLVANCFPSMLLGRDTNTIPQKCSFPPAPRINHPLLRGMVATLDSARQGQVTT